MRDHRGNGGWARVALRGAAALTFAGFVAPGCSLQQPQNAIDVNWHQQTATLHRPRTNRVAEIQVSGLNRLCYDYAFPVQQTLASDAGVGIQTLLNALAGQQGASGDTGKSNTSTQGTAGRYGILGKPLGGRLHIALDSSAAATLKRVAADLGNAESALDAADAHIVEIDSAGPALKAFVQGECPRTPARGIDPGAIADAWKANAVAKLDYAELATTLAKTAQTARAVLDSTRAKLNALPNDPCPDADHGRGGGANPGPIAVAACRERALRDRLRALEGGKLEHARRQAASIEALKQAIDKATKDTTFVTQAFLLDNADTLGLEIKATRTVNPDTPAVPLDEHHPIPTLRWHRLFVSTGLLWTGLRSHDFGRATLPVAAGSSAGAAGPDATGDSTYSTYIDRGDTHGFAFQPAVFLNTTLADLELGGFQPTLILSGGIVKRHVNQSDGIEPLLGASVGLSDHAVLSVLWHRGRVERLLLGPPEDVRKRPVPVTVTDESAIGETWRSALSLALSWRL